MINFLKFILLSLSDQVRTMRRFNLKKYGIFHGVVTGVSTVVGTGIGIRKAHQKNIKIAVEYPDRATPKKKAERIVGGAVTGAVFGCMYGLFYPVTIPISSLQYLSEKYYE
jgi:hypothetical protein